ncbi:hypothetical protein GS532_27940 [Rhodococcus hoagii]|nr:hypothetical protein [Prescottella equi]
MKDLIVDTWRRLSALDRVIFVVNLLVGAWNLGAASYSIGFMSLCIAVLYAAAMSNLHRVKETGRTNRGTRQKRNDARRFGMTTIVGPRPATADNLPALRHIRDD